MIQELRILIQDLAIFVLSSVVIYDYFKIKELTLVKDNLHFWIERLESKKPNKSKTRKKVKR